MSLEKLRLWCLEGCDDLAALYLLPSMERESLDTLVFDDGHSPLQTACLHSQIAMAKYLILTAQVNVDRPKTV